MGRFSVWCNTPVTSSHLGCVSRYTGSLSRNKVNNLLPDSQTTVVAIVSDSGLFVQLEAAALLFANLCSGDISHWTLYLSICDTGPGTSHLRRIVCPDSCYCVRLSTSVKRDATNWTRETHNATNPELPTYMTRATGWVKTENSLLVLTETISKHIDKPWWFCIQNIAGSIHFI